MVDNDRAVHDSLKCLLSGVGLAMESYASAEEFLDCHDADRPGCLVLEARVPGMGGLELHRRLLERHIDLPVIMVTSRGDIKMASYCFRMGVFDFMQKPCDPEELLERIREAIDKDAGIRREKAELAQVVDRISLLSTSERQVMRLLIEGHSNKSVAARLRVAERTVEDRRARIMAKMEVRSLVELVRVIMARPFSMAHLSLDQDGGMRR